MTIYSNHQLLYQIMATPITTIPNEDSKGYPLLNRYIIMEHHHIQWVIQLQMAIVHSDVTLLPVTLVVSFPSRTASPPGIPGAKSLQKSKAETWAGSLNGETIGFPGRSSEFYHVYIYILIIYICIGYRVYTYMYIYIYINICMDIYVYLFAIIQHVQYTCYLHMCFFNPETFIYLAIYRSIYPSIHLYVCLCIPSGKLRQTWKHHHVKTIF